MKKLFLLFSVLISLGSSFFAQSVVKSSFSCFQPTNSETSLQLLGGQVLAGESSSTTILHGYYPLVLLNTSVFNEGLLSLEVYPNPFTSIINIHISNHGEAKIALYNLSGQRLLFDRISSNPHSLDLNSIEAGVYYLKIIDEEGKVMVKKIIKQ